MAQIEAHDLLRRSVSGDRRHHRRKGIAVAIGDGVQIDIIAMTCDVL